MRRGLFLETDSQDHQDRKELESLFDAMRDAGPPPRFRGVDLKTQELPADFIHDFILLEELGQGGQGIVFRARQESTQREVALKLLREGPLADARSRHRFDREIEIVAGLEHSGIVTIYAAGRTEDGHGWVAMELVDGSHLRDYLNRVKPNRAQRFGLFDQIAEAMMEAHQHGVIHLDLKPANVLVKANGQVRVVDFGLARSLLQESTTLSMEAMGGTPGFMAPEQVQSGLAACTVRTDVHALGALLFFLFTEQPPYEEAATAFSTLERVAAGELRNLDRALSNRDMVAICRKAMALHPKDRYRNAEELLQDVHAMETGGFVTARQGDQRYRRHRALRRIAPIAGILLLAGGITWVAVATAMHQRELTKLADDRFVQAQEIAEAFLLEIDPLLEALPGAGPARERIIQRGTDYLEQLLVSAEEHPSLRLKAAKGFHQIARVQADVYTMSSGRLEEAFVSIERMRLAIPTLEVLQDLSTQEQERAFLLGIEGHLLASRVARDLGQADRQAEELTQAFEAIQNGNPFDSFDALRTESTVLDEWARLQVIQGDVAEGKKYMQRSRSLLEQLMEQFGSDSNAMVLLQRDFAVQVLREAELAKVTGDLEGAGKLLMKFYLSAMHRFEDTGSLPALTDMSIGEERLANLCAARDQWKVAFAWMEKARDHHLEIRQAQPNHPTVWAAQISATNRLGEFALAGGDVGIAKDWFQRFTEECEEFVKAFPDFPRALRMLGVAHYKAYELAMAEGASQVALEALDRSLTVFLAMQEQGILSAEDASIPAALEQEKGALKLQLKGS